MEYLDNLEWEETEEEDDTEKDFMKWLMKMVLIEMEDMCYEHAD